jgi:saccharopine dehydrogenase-like NADP-dependent oxidoreductase
MPNHKPKIVTLGATGQVGQGVVENLKHNSTLEVIAAARSPGKAKSLGVPAGISLQKRLRALCRDRKYRKQALRYLQRPAFPLMSAAVRFHQTGSA